MGGIAALFGRRFAAVCYKLMGGVTREAEMRDRKDFVCVILLFGATVLYGTCGEVAGQSSQRGYSSRGVNPVGAAAERGSARATRPSTNQSMYRNRANVNTGRPAEFRLHAPLEHAPDALLRLIGLQRGR